MSRMMEVRNLSLNFSVIHLFDLQDLHQSPIRFIQFILSKILMLWAATISD